MISVLQGKHEMGTGMGRGNGSREENQDNCGLGATWETTVGTIVLVCDVRWCDTMLLPVKSLAAEVKVRLSQSRATGGREAGKLHDGVMCFTVENCMAPRSTDKQELGEGRPLEWAGRPTPKVPGAAKGPKPRS